MARQLFLLWLRALPDFYPPCAQAVSIQQPHYGRNRRLEMRYVPAAQAFQLLANPPKHSPMPITPQKSPASRTASSPSTARFRPQQGEVVDGRSVVCGRNWADRRKGKALTSGIVRKLPAVFSRLSRRIYGDTVIAMWSATLESRTGSGPPGHKGVNSVS